jgi:chemotaxis protein MotA
MKASAAIGLGLTFAMLALGDIVGGGSPLHLFNLSAALVVLGGTLGATIASTSVEQIKLVPALYKKALMDGPPDYKSEVDRIVQFAEKARREGLLALDAEVAEIEDDFLRKGMQLVVDGTDPEVVREILEAELDGMAARHKSGAQTFIQAGGFAPTIGILGTTMHLVLILKSLDNPETLGPMIAAAFIATLYGIGSANALFLPVGNRLKVLSTQEQEVKTMVVEGVLAVQAGENPRLIADRLMTFVPPNQRGDSSDGAERAEDGPSLAEAA